MVRVFVVVHCEVIMDPPSGRSLVQAALSDHLPTLEPLLAEVARLHMLASFILFPQLEAGHYLEVGQLPARVAESLGVSAACPR